MMRAMRRCAALAAAEGVKAGLLINATRVAIVGRAVAPPLFETMVVLGKEKVVEQHSPGCSSGGCASRRSSAAAVARVPVRRKTSGCTGCALAVRSRNTNLNVHGNLHRRQASCIVTRLIAQRDRDSRRPQGRLGVRRKPQLQGHASGVDIERFIRGKREFLEPSIRINRVVELESGWKLRQ